MALVLDRDTGLVSPQFHVLFDNEFQTVKDDKYDSSWQIKAGFTSQRELEVENRKKDSAPVIIPGISKYPSTQTKAAEGAVPTGTTGILKHKSFKRKADDDVYSQKVKPHKRQRLDKGIKWKDDISNQEGLRKFPRLNPELNKAHELLSLQATIMSKQECDVPGEIFCMQLLTTDASQIYEFLNPIALKASTDPDTMYMHHAMRQPNRKEFIQAMEKEVQDQMENGNFTIVHKDTVPKDRAILPAVWQMKR